MEITEEPKTGEELKNYTYTTDLWQRVISLHNICRAYINSTFVKSMEGQFIRPPIIRTNAILKNKNLRQCLELWEFIETYENIGYDMLVQENLETIDQKYIKEIYSVSALQYLIFRYNIKNEFDSDKELANRVSNSLLSPEIQSELGELNASEFNKTYERVPRATVVSDSNGKEKQTHRDKSVLRAVDVALISDALIKRLDLNPTFPKRRLKPVWFKKVESTVAKMQKNAKQAGDGVKNATVKAVQATAGGVKRGWDASEQKVGKYCRSHSEQMERVADIAADVALKAALIGMAAICKEKERRK
jgi:hypothetical protein